MKGDTCKIIGIYTFFISTFLTIAACSSTKSSTSGSSGSNSSASTSNEKKVVVTPSTPVVEANMAPGLEKQLLDLVNEYRKKKKLAPLQANAAIEYQARRHSMDMGTHRIPFGHQGLSFRTKYIMEKVPGAAAVSENIAYGNLSAQAVMEDWLKSAEHRKNMEGSFKFTGIGVTRNMQNQLYYTQIFAK